MTSFIGRLAQGVLALPATGAPAVVRRTGTRVISTAHGRFAVADYQSLSNGDGYTALVLGRVSGKDDVLVRAHSQCLTGDALGSLRCDCGPQLDLALRTIARERRGVLLYMLGQEGRGIGLLDKVRAYALQDGGTDTVDANLQLGLPADSRDYADAGAVLLDLGVRSVRLMTNNPAKCAGLARAGVTITARVPLEVAAGSANAAYLATKRDRMGHLL